VNNPPINNLDSVFKQLNQNFNMGPLNALMTDRKAPALNKVMDKSIVNQLNDSDYDELIEFLPEGQKEKKFLLENILSPQFQSSLSTLDSAVFSDYCVDIFKSFNIFDQEIFNNAKDRKIISHRSFRTPDQ
jgi:hypothetical protein